MSELVHVGEVVVSLPDRAETINAAHGRVLANGALVLADACLIGDELIAVKAKLKHGEWLPWIESNLVFDARTAQMYARLAANAKSISHLDGGIVAALDSIATPRTQAVAPPPAPTPVPTLQAPRPVPVPATPEQVQEAIDRLGTPRPVERTDGPVTDADRLARDAQYRLVRLRDAMTITAGALADAPADLELAGPPWSAEKFAEQAAALTAQLGDFVAKVAP